MEGSTGTLVKWFFATGIRIGAIILVTAVAIGVVRMLIARSRKRLAAGGKADAERVKRTETLTKIIENVARVVILVAALLMVLKQVGVEIGPLLAGAGIIGLAVSFGAQSLVKDVINGFFFLLENNMNVGDVVEVAGISGLVERVTLRVTVLRDLEGKVHVVPNGDISVVTNMTKEWSRAVVDVPVAYRESIDRVIALLKETGVELRADAAFGSSILEPMELLGVENLGDSSMTVKVMFKTVPGKQWQVAREFRRRVKNAFDEKGIRIPYPHREFSFAD